MDSSVLSNRFTMADSIAGRNERARTTPGCPVCGWNLYPAGGMWRCGRCQFNLCVGCCVAEPAEGESVRGDEGVTWES